MQNSIDLQMADRLQELRDEKEQLELSLKETNAMIEAVEQDLIAAMVTAELDSFKRNGHTYSLKVETYASAKADRKEELFKATMREVEDRIRIRRGDSIASLEAEAENPSSDMSTSKQHTSISPQLLTGRHSDREKLNCTIDIAEDAMTAYLMLYGKSDGDYTYEELLQYLKENGIIYSRGY